VATGNIIAPECSLARHDWFAGGRYSIADIALYGYTHCAADDGFDLSANPAVGAWLKWVEKGLPLLAPVTSSGGPAMVFPLVSILQIILAI